MLEPWRRKRTCKKIDIVERMVAHAMEFLARGDPLVNCGLVTQSDARINVSEDEVVVIVARRTVRRRNGGSYLPINRKKSEHCSRASEFRVTAIDNNDLGTSAAEESDQGGWHRLIHVEAIAPDRN